MDSMIKIVRKIAKGKEFSIIKVRNKNLWDIRDDQTGKFVKRGCTITEVYNFLANVEY